MNYPHQQPVSEEQIAGMFDRIAHRYDFLNRLLSFRQDHRWRKRLAAMVPYRPTGVLLDMATGTGDILTTCHESHPEYSHMLGIDISAAMLKRAQVKLKRQITAKQIELKQGSAENIELAADSVDCVTIAFGLRNVVDKRKAMTEFSRVLRRDGVLLILEFFNPPNDWFGRLFKFYFHQILPRIAGVFSDRDAYTYLPQSVGSFYTTSELRGVLYELGFIVEEQVPYIFGACALVKARKVGSIDD